MSATMTKNKGTRKQRRDNDRIRRSMPSGEAAKRLALPRLTRVTTDEYVNSTLGNKSGFATFALEVGDATYRAVTWCITSTAAIAGVTTEIAGTHYVDVEHLEDYLDEVRIVANGTNMQSLSMAELVQRNSFMQINFGPVYSGFGFPGTNTYDNQRMIDAFALGTHGMDTLTLETKLKAAFDADTMEIEVVPYVVDMPVATGFCYVTERTNATFASEGKHTFFDLPVGDDIGNIWLIAEDIAHVKVEVDGDLLFEMSRAAYEAYLTEKGRNVDAMAGSWFLDLHAEGMPSSIAALDSAKERRRDARIKLEITTTAENVAVEFLVTHADLYQRIR